MDVNINIHFRSLHGSTDAGDIKPHTQQQTGRLAMDKESNLFKQHSFKKLQFVANCCVKQQDQSTCLPAGSGLNRCSVSGLLLIRL